MVALNNSFSSQSVEQELIDLLNSVKASLASAKSLHDIEQLKIKFLGKKSELVTLLKQISQAPVSERPRLGQAVNQFKQTAQDLFRYHQELLEKEQLANQLKNESLDITLPGRRQALGGFHPISRTMNRVEELFTAMGFNMAVGPEIEDEHHNFDALNLLSHHPARDSVATFYFDNGLLLRTHTSPVQIRVMKSTTPPIRVITPGRVYRRDSDQTHTPMFHQLEGLVIDEETNFSNLKYLLQVFLNQFFETEINLRFRPSFFPFTEPSAEVDIMHLLCAGKGCRTCGFSGWLEVLGCGMVHPQVLKNIGIDSEQYQGFAFGLGLDRLTMLRYNVSDLRIFFENDVRVLQQFK